jgi:cysteine synthase
MDSCTRLNTDIYDSIIKVGNETAMEMARRVAKEEGILSGLLLLFYLYPVLWLFE